MAANGSSAAAMNLVAEPGAAAAAVPLRARGPVEDAKLAIAGLGGAAAGGALPAGGLGGAPGQAPVQPDEPAVDPEEAEDKAALISLKKGVAMSAPPEGRFLNALNAATNKAIHFVSKYSLRLLGREHDLHPSPLTAASLLRMYDLYVGRAGPIARTTPLRTAAAASPFAVQKEPMLMCSYGNQVTFDKLMKEFARLRAGGIPLPFLTFWYDVQVAEASAGVPDRWHFDLSFFFKTKALMQYTATQAAAAGRGAGGLSGLLAGARQVVASPTDKYHFSIGLSNLEIMLAQSAVRQKPPIPIVGSFSTNVEHVTFSAGGAGAAPTPTFSNQGHRISFILVGNSLILTESWATFEFDYFGDIPAWKVLKVIREGFSQLLQDWPIYEIYRPCLLQEVGGGVRVARYTPQYISPTQREIAMSSNFQPLETEFSIGEAKGKCTAWGGILSNLSVQRTNLRPGLSPSDLADGIRTLVYDQIEDSLHAANSANKKQAWMASMLGYFYGGGRTRSFRRSRNRNRRQRRRRRTCGKSRR